VLIGRVEQLWTYPVKSFAGVPVDVPALTVNRLCGSGIQAAISGAERFLNAWHGRPMRARLSEIADATGEDERADGFDAEPAPAFGRSMAPMPIAAE